MANVSYVENLEGVQQFLRELGKRIEDVRPALEEIGQSGRNITEEAFESGVSPWGDVWTPLAASTLERKGVKAGSPMSTGKLLYETGRLRESLYYTLDGDGRSVVIGANAKSADGYPYPAVMQFGTEDGRVPARMFLPIDPDGELAPVFAREILAILDEHITIG